MLIDTGTLLRSGSRRRQYRQPFKITDVKALLGSHEHFDHVGGMARLQQASGAPVLVGAGAVDVIRTGKDDPRDPQAGCTIRWSP